VWDPAQPGKADQQGLDKDAWLRKDHWHVENLGKRGWIQDKSLGDRGYLLPGQKVAVDGPIVSAPNQQLTLPRRPVLSLLLCGRLGGTNKVGRCDLHCPETLGGSIAAAAVTP